MIGSLVSEYCVSCQIVAKLCIYNKFSIWRWRLNWSDEKSPLNLCED